MTPAEIKEKILMNQKTVKKIGNKATRTSENQTVPSDWDWRAHGAVSAVKDQGTLGTCWAFSTVGNLEGQMAITKGNMTDLSVEYLMECDASYDGTYEADCGMFGGWPDLAMQYIINKGGIFSDAQMPYCAGMSSKQPEKCWPCMAAGYSWQGCGKHEDLWCDKSTTIG